MIELRRGGRPGFIPFLTHGFPTPADTPRLLTVLADAGADVIELGVPFSDPLADGPTIQRASWLALEQGVTLERTLRPVADLSEGDLVCDHRAGFEAGSAGALQVDGRGAG